eukprot:COSAG01_NODE_25965_length_727_cov_2.383758_1_plen_45_part_01
MPRAVPIGGTGSPSSRCSRATSARTRATSVAVSTLCSRCCSYAYP